MWKSDNPVFIKAEFCLLVKVRSIVDTYGEIEDNSQEKNFFYFFVRKFFYFTFSQEVLDKQSLAGCEHSENHLNEEGNDILTLMRRIKGKFVRVRTLLVCLIGNWPRRKSHNCPKDWNIFLPATIPIKQSLRWN